MHTALSRIWWLLALCGVLDALHAAMNLFMLEPGGAVVLRRFALPGAVWDMGMLALAAGACAVIAGLWRGGRDDGWLVAVHGIALAVFGAVAVSPLVRGPLRFRPVSLLLVLMAVSIGVFAWRMRLPRSAAPAAWLWTLAGAVSIAFAVSFLAVGFSWVRLEAPSSFWIWMSAYFGFCATFMLWLALRVRLDGRSASIPAR